MYSDTVVQHADDSFESRRVTSTPNSSMIPTSSNQLSNTFEIGLALDQVFSQHMEEKSHAETGKYSLISSEPDE